jgi:nucleoside-diphosphate-sugar epimerase
LAQGYSQSKWITERLLHAAGKKTGVSSAVLRIGQVAGPVDEGVRGVWNKVEWLPSVGFLFDLHLPLHRLTRIRIDYCELKISWCYTWKPWRSR